MFKVLIFQGFSSVAQELLNCCMKTGSPDFHFTCKDLTITQQEYLMKNILRKTALAAALALPLMASAEAITFDMNGAAAGQSYTVDVLDWTVGNALAIDGNPNTGLLVGSEIQLLYQANLGLVSLGGTTVAAAGLGGAQNFTVVAGFQEEVIANSGTSVQFDLINPVLAPTANNFFYIYANTVGNNLAGTGFVGGTLVMSGFISDVLSSNYATQGGTGLFDQFGADNYAGLQTLIGSGATDINVTISSYDTNYFSGLLAGDVLSLALTNTSTLTPFSQVDPSRLFSSNGTVGGNTASDLGTINGVTQATTQNFQFQADGNSSFMTTNSVPEPGSLALVGLALGAVGFVSRRRSSKKA